MAHFHSYYHSYGWTVVFFVLPKQHNGGAGLQLLFLDFHYIRCFLACNCPNEWWVHTLLDEGQGQRVFSLGLTNRLLAGDKVTSGYGREARALH